MNIKALEKIAGIEDEVLPLGVGGAAAYLANKLMSPDEKEKDKEDTWSKVLRYLAVTGSAFGAYSLGKAFGGGAPIRGETARRIDELEDEKEGLEGIRTGTSIATPVLGTTAFGAAAAAPTMALTNWARTARTPGLNFRTRIGRSPLPLLIGAAISGAGAWGSNKWNSYATLKSEELKRRIDEVKENASK